MDAQSNSLSHDLLRWYDQHRRRHLPWREQPGPYRTWVSEVMLQQTRVETVIPYFERFMARFPTVQALADAPLDEVLSLWSGLGYYSRARNLHAAAVQVAALPAFPDTVAGLKALPGVGDYMAGAIASIALGLDVATVDGNIERVLSRIHRFVGTRRRLTSLAQGHLPAGRAGDFNQALMDLGTSICTPRGPACPDCPVRPHCRAQAAGEVDQFPVKRARRPAPRRLAAAAVITREGRILLARRHPSGLFGGLYELPTVFTEGRPAEEALARLMAPLVSTPVVVGEAMGAVHQQLTHMHIELRLFRVSGDATEGPVQDPTYDMLRWVDGAEVAEIGVSTLARRSLRAALSLAPPAR